MYFRTATVLTTFFAIAIAASIPDVSQGVGNKGIVQRQTTEGVSLPVLIFTILQENVRFADDNSSYLPASFCCRYSLISAACLIPTCLSPAKVRRADPMKVLRREKTEMLL
jgi:hypothetical protein